MVSAVLQCAAIFILEGGPICMLHCVVSRRNDCVMAHYEKYIKKRRNGQMEPRSYTIFSSNHLKY